MKTTVLFLLFTFASFIYKAQYLDSLGEVIRGKANIDLRYETRWSFVNNKPFTIKGAKIGLAFAKKLRLGIGVNWLKTDLNRTTQHLNEMGNVETLTEYFKLGYLSAYADVVFYKTKHWQLSVPIQIGVGYTWTQYQENYKLNGMQSRNFLFLYEPGITTQYKITRWAGVGFEVAYRFALQNYKNIGEELSSPTYSLKLSIWLDQLFFILAPNSGWSKKEGPAAW